MTTTGGKSAWYREPMVWLIIAIPLVSMISGLSMLWIAIATDDGVVEDDYYHRGKEINRVLARDRAALAHGLASEVDLGTRGGELIVRLSARAALAPPAQLEVRFLHATRGGHDRTVILPRYPDGSYRAPRPELAPGRWNLQLSAQDWRLVGSLVVPGATRVTVGPAAL